MQRPYQVCLKQHNIHSTKWAHNIPTQFEASVDFVIGLENRRPRFRCWKCCSHTRPIEWRWIAWWVACRYAVVYFLPAPPTSSSSRQCLQWFTARPGSDRTRTSQRTSRKQPRRHRHDSRLHENDWSVYTTVSRSAHVVICFFIHRKSPWPSISRFLRN